MSILNNEIRDGNFTSSKIVALTTNGRAKGSFGASFYTYIKNKKWERMLGRSLETETIAKALSWGKLLESRGFDLMGLEYTPCSQVTIQHPTIPYWAGSPDCYKDNKETVAEQKCPITLTSFCQLVEPIRLGLTGMDAINHIRENHKEGETYYYQIVSNAILLGAKYGELIIYMPYESEIPEIKQMADGVDDCMWLFFSKEGELPFIKDGGVYKNLNIIRFEIPQEDKDFLTNRVLEAGKLLLEDEPQILLAHHDSDLKATIVEPESIISKLTKIK